MTKDTTSIPNYTERTPRFYLEKIEPEVLKSFNPQQLNAITTILREAIPRSSPKLVDLRFVVDLVLARFFVVILVGKDRRSKPRRYIPEGVAKLGNFVAAVVILLGFSLLVSSSFILFVYLGKTVLGFDLFSGFGFSDLIKQIL